MLFVFFTGSALLRSGLYITFSLYILVCYADYAQDTFYTVLYHILLSPLIVLTHPIFFHLPTYNSFLCRVTCYPPCYPPCFPTTPLSLPSVALLSSCLSINHPRLCCVPMTIPFIRASHHRCHRYLLPARSLTPPSWITTGAYQAHQSSIRNLLRHGKHVLDI